MILLIFYLRNVVSPKDLCWAPLLEIFNPINLKQCFLNNVSNIISYVLLVIRQMKQHTAVTNKFYFISTILTFPKCKLVLQHLQGKFFCTFLPHKFLH